MSERPMTVGDLLNLLQRVIGSKPELCDLPVWVQSDSGYYAWHSQIWGVSVRPTCRRGTTEYSEPNLLIHRIMDDDCQNEQAEEDEYVVLTP